MVAYYITTDDKIEEHEVVVKDGYAIFNTNHFSTYTIGVKSEENPNTYDGIITYIIMGLISVIGLVGIIIHLKKKYN